MNHSDAEDDLMRVMDTLGDWLGGELYQAPTEPYRTQHQVDKIDFDEAPVGTLLAIAFDTGIDHTSRCLAMTAIRERFLETKMAREIVAQMRAEDCGDNKQRAVEHYTAMAAEAAR